MQEATSRKREIIAVLAVLIVIAAIATSAIISANKKEDDSTASTTPATTTSQQTTTDPSASSSVASDMATTYKDGTYSASGRYNTPGGTEEVTVNVTLAGGTVTASSVEGKATDQTAKEYQDEFIAGYQSQVNGKSVAEINLSRVSGSSLTSRGFNDALSQIRQQASS